MQAWLWLIFTVFGQPISKMQALWNLDSMQAVTDSAVQPTEHTVQPASSAMPCTVKLHLTLAQPFLVEGGDPMPPCGVMDILTYPIFPDYMGGTGMAPTRKGTGRAGEDITKDQKESSSLEIKLWERDVILCHPQHPHGHCLGGVDICPVGMTNAPPHHFWVSRSVLQWWDQPGTLWLTCLTSREAQTRGHLASY